MGAGGSGQRVDVRVLTEKALEAAHAAGAGYADVRVVSRRTEDITTKNGNVDKVSTATSSGFGIRVLYEGAWGFAASSLKGPPNLDEVLRVAEEAVAIARASALAKAEPPVTLAPVELVRDRWQTSLREDPFAVKLEDKVDLLLQADRLLREDARIRVAEASLSLFREEKVFASSEGAYIEQARTETGAGISALAVEAGEAQRRSYPSSFGGDHAAAGFEFVRELDLPGHAEETAQEALALLEAPRCPSGQTTVILGSSQLALQVHESCGHPAELDRVFGTEASYAGTSFLTPEKLGRFRYGSPAVNLTADATLPGGLGTFAYDDEGVPAQRVPLVENGLFVNYLTSREMAARLSQQTSTTAAPAGTTAEAGTPAGAAPRSNGTMRADGWNRIPLIRMTNINLEPGDWSLDELIADTREGIYMETNRSWSIDDRRLNFQFGTEVAYEIKDGSLGRLLKSPTYTGMTPEFWRSCDAVCDRKHWHLWGLPTCGKGEPAQVMRVGHGTAPARFRNVRVGVV